MPYWASSLFTPLAVAFGGQAADWRALGWASGVGVMLSCQTAFFCFRALTSPDRAFAAAPAYMIAPYHLAVDLLQRAAYPELWAFAWMPLAPGGLIGLAKHPPRAWEITVCGLALLYMMHLPTTLTFMPFVVLFALSQGTRVFAEACSAIAAACGVAAVFLVPMLTTEWAVKLRRHPFPYKLTFFFPNLNILALLYSMDCFNERLLWIFLLLAATWLLCLVTGLARRLTWKTGRDQVVWLGLGFVALVMMLPISNFVYKVIPVFQWIQFSRRFLAPATLVFWPGIDWVGGARHGVERDGGDGALHGRNTIQPNLPGAPGHGGGPATAARRQPGRRVRIPPAPGGPGRGAGADGRFAREGGRGQGGGCGAQMGAAPDPAPGEGHGPRAGRAQAVLLSGLVGYNGGREGAAREARGQDRSGPLRGAAGPAGAHGAAGGRSGGRNGLGADAVDHRRLSCQMASAPPRRRATGFAMAHGRAIAR